MANKVNNWEELLKLANEDLIQQQVYINVNSNGDGTYTIEIVDNDRVECYADGYYEDELGDLINDAWAHARAKIKALKDIEKALESVPPQIVYLVSAYYDKGICDDDEPVLEIYATEELAKARVGQMIRDYKDRLHRSAENAEDWTETGDSLKAYGYEPYSWNVEISWAPDIIRTKIN